MASFTPFASNYQRLVSERVCVCVFVNVCVNCWPIRFPSTHTQRVAALNTNHVYLLYLLDGHCTH